jgi:hypothetical protein
MQVNETVGDVIRPDATQKMLAVPPDSTTGSTTHSTGALRRSAGKAFCADQIQLSDANRVFSESGVTDGDRAAALDPHRENDIRSKIVNGAYHSLDMADHVARAILRSGDV